MPSRRGVAESLGRPARVGGRCEDDPDEEEGENRLDQNSLHSGEIDCELRRSGLDHIATKQAEANERGDKGTQKKDITTAKRLAARIFDRVRPLPANLVAPLEKFQASTTPPKPDDQLL